MYSIKYIHGHVQVYDVRGRFLVELIGVSVFGGQRA